MNGSAEMDKNPINLKAAAAFLFTAGLMASFFYLDTYCYEVNDDIAITALVKGLFGITPSGEGVFISPFLGSLLFLSYKLLPAVPWFSLLLYLGLALAFFLGSLTILLAVRTLGGQIAGLLGVAFLLCVTAFEINFAAVSLLLWITGCVFLSLSVRRNLPANIWFWLAASQLAAAYLLRPSLLPITILLAVPLFLTLLQGGERRLARWAFTPLIIALSLSLLCGMVTRGGSAYPEYLEFNKIRSEFLDTSRGNPTPQTPQALFSAKWSYEDYVVSQNWWLFSSHFNTDQIKAFLEKNAKKSSIFSADDVKSNFFAYKIYFIVIFLWFLVILLQNKLIEIKKIKVTDLLVYFFLVFIVCLLMGIRFPQRVAYPCFFMLFLNSLILFEGLNNSNSSLISKIVPPLVFISFLIYALYPIANLEMEYIQRIKNNKIYFDQSLHRIVQKNGADTIFVDVTPHVIANNYFPFQEDDTILTKRTLPGGWLVGSPAYLDFLKKEGLGDRSTVVAAMIDNRRMVLRFWDSRELSYNAYLKNFFLQHLRQRYTVPGSDRYIDLKLLEDHRLGVFDGLMYFHLVTVPREPVVINQ